MTDFPRATGAMPRLITPPIFSVGMQSWGQSGKGQFRSVQNIGRMWEEVYPILDTANPNVRALIEVLNRSLRDGLVWTIQHPYWQVRQGLGGGTPVVNGSNQVGSTLNIDGATAGVTGWLKHGDLVQVAGCSVIFDVTADVNSNGSGQVAIPVSPTIYTGQSPADEAAVTIDPTLIKFNVAIVSVSGLPSMDSTRYINAGMTVLLREAPQ